MGLMVDVTRRSVLAVGALGAVGLLVGCAPVRSMPSPTPSPTPVGAPDWQALAASIRGVLSLPGSSGYDVAKLTENPSYDAAEPLAVLTAASASDVARALAFATRYRVPLALRSGGHSYPGWSSGGAPGTGMPTCLVIDSRGMSAVVLNADSTVTIGSGASLAQVYSALGGAGRAIAGGSCATVGIAGLTLGGGVGVLVRAYGLTCDALTAVQIVTADGRVRTVTATRDAELFWACRGGGGGHLGVVTSLTFTTVAAPTVTMFFLSWPFGAAAPVIAAWQNWAPRADSRLWSTLKLLGGTAHPGGPELTVSGTWIGDAAALDGQLAPFLAAVGAAPSEQDAGTHAYENAMMRYAGCAGIPLAACQTGSGGELPREPSANTSHVAYATLDATGIADLLAQVNAAQAVPGMTEGGISMDALGGAVASVAPVATAFVHRAALATVQYTSTFAVGAAPAAYYAYVRGFRRAMTPHWGDGAYVNYADAQLSDPAQAYFGANAARLAAVAAAYDPRGLFTQPQPY